VVVQDFTGNAQVGIDELSIVMAAVSAAWVTAAMMCSRMGRSISGPVFSRNQAFSPCDAATTHLRVTQEISPRLSGFFEGGMESDDFGNCLNDGQHYAAILLTWDNNAGDDATHGNEVVSSHIHDQGELTVWLRPCKG
jgi:hypothetical protein